MKISCILVTLLSLYVCNTAAQDCCIITEVYKILVKAIHQFAPEKDQHPIYAGCLKGFFLCNPDECNQEKFKLSQAPMCEEVIRHTDMKKKCKEHCLMNYKSMAENAIYSNGGDADEVCEKIPIDGEKMLKKIQATIDNPDQALEMYEKFCKKDPKGCQELKEMPKEAEEYFLKDISPAFKDLIKILKSTAKSKSMPAAGAFGQGIELLFGGGDFGIKASKCVNKIMEIGTKFGKGLGRK